MPPRLIFAAFYFELIKELIMSINFLSFVDTLYLNFIKDDRYMYIVNGFITTLKITVLSVIIGIVIGVVCAVIKVAGKRNIVCKILGYVVDIYTTIFRGVPVMVQYLIAFVIIMPMMGIKSVFVAAVFTFGINSGAYVSENIRAGIEAVDKGQEEAGRSLGFTYGKTMFLIILPQAIKNILPALGNEFIALLKETSIAGTLGVIDLTKAARIIQSQTYDGIVPLFTAAAIYLIIVLILTQLLKILERRLKKSDRN